MRFPGLGRLRGTAGGRAASAVPDETGDRMGEASLRHRTYDEVAWHRKLVRGLLMVCLAQGLLNVLFLDGYRVLLQALGEKEVVVATVEGTSGIAAEVARVEFGTERARDIQERLAIGYLKMWFEVVPDEVRMQRRWATDCLDNPEPLATYRDDECGYMFTHSSVELYRYFLKQPLIAEGLVTELIDEGVWQLVELTAEPIWHSRDRLELRFKVTQKQDNTVISERLGIANMQFVFNRAGAAATQRTRFLNPHDFRVLAFDAVDTTETEQRRLR